MPAHDVDADLRNRLSEMLFAGDTIGAIKVYRTATGEGLDMARWFVENLEDELRRSHPRRFDSGTRAASAPWVGLGGTANTIAVVRQAGRIVCRLSHPTYLLVLGVTAAFGPGAIAMCLLTAEGRSFLRFAPRPIVAFVLLLFLGSAALLVYHLVRYHWLEIDRRTGTMRFHGTWGDSTALVLRLDAIRDLQISPLAYVHSDSDGVTTNHVLTAVLQDGTRRGLCLSADQALVERLAQDIRSLGIAEAAAATSAAPGS